AEPSSGARGGPTAIAGYRGALSALGEGIERAIVYGRPTLSRDVSALLARKDVEVVVVDPRGDWVDVAGTAAVVAPAATANGAGDPAWLEQWRVSGAAAQRDALAGEDLTGPQAV